MRSSDNKVGSSSGIGVVLNKQKARSIYECTACHFAKPGQVCLACEFALCRFQMTQKCTCEENDLKAEY